MPTPTPSYTFTALNPAGASFTQAETTNDRGEVAGTYIGSSRSHGFVYDNGTYTTLNVPGASDLFARAINNLGEVTGYYEDSSGEHGFLASPQGGEAAASGLGEMLSAHARLGGMRDFRSDAPGINDGSPHSENASDMMARTFAAGTRFASFGGMADDHAVTRALLHANGSSLGTG
jgi:uncharacterized membrane protein